MQVGVGTTGDLQCCDEATVPLPAVVIFLVPVERLEQPRLWAQLPPSLASCAGGLQRCCRLRQVPS